MFIQSHLEFKDMLQCNLSEDCWLLYPVPPKAVYAHCLDEESEVLVTESKDTVLYVYCRSGARSRQAVSLLKHMGYTNVHNIGGIAAYSGKVE